MVAATVVVMAGVTSAGSAAAEQAPPVSETPARPPAKQTIPTPPDTRESRARKPKVTLSGGAQLTVAVKPALPGKRNYPFTLQRKRGSKWKKVGNYTTRGNPELRRFTVATGTYRANVKAFAGRKSATSKAYSFTPRRAGHYGQDADFIYYYPAGYGTAGKRYPTIVAFDPGGGQALPGAYDAQLRAAADRHGFLVMTSKYYRNQTFDTNGNPVWLRDGNTLQMSYNPNGNPRLSFLSPAYPAAKAQIDRAFASHPVDTSRVVLLGISGGGSFAHAMNILYPNLATAIVINTGMIWDGVTNGPPWSSYLNGERSSASFGQSRRLAYFLESVDDFRYDEMLNDAGLYRSKGWTVNEILFAGGHTLAPPSVYADVFARLTTQPGW